MITAILALAAAQISAVPVENRKDPKWLCAVAEGCYPEEELEIKASMTNDHTANYKSTEGRGSHMKQGQAEKRSMTHHRAKAADQRKDLSGNKHSASKALKTGEQVGEPKTKSNRQNVI